MFARASATSTHIYLLCAQLPTPPTLGAERRVSPDSTTTFKPHEWSIGPHSVEHTRSFVMTVDVPRLGLHGATRRQDSYTGTVDRRLYRSA